MHEDNEEIENAFEYHAPDEAKIERHSEVRKHSKALAYLFAGLPEGRERAVALTKLEEAMFWANAAIARN